VISDEESGRSGATACATLNAFHEVSHHSHVEAVTCIPSPRDRQRLNLFAKSGVFIDKGGGDTSGADPMR
jgi:hypothetical protein